MEDIPIFQSSNDNTIVHFTLNEELKKKQAEISKAQAEVQIIPEQPTKKNPPQAQAQAQTQKATTTTTTNNNNNNNNNNNKTKKKTNEDDPEYYERNKEFLSRWPKNLATNARFSLNHNQQQQQSKWFTPLISPPSQSSRHSGVLQLMPYARGNIRELRIVRILRQKDNRIIHEVLHRINPEDVIGADLQFEFPNKKKKSMRNHHDYHQQQENNQQSQINQQLGCGAISLLRDTSISSSNNEDTNIDYKDEILEKKIQSTMNKSVICAGVGLPRVACDGIGDIYYDDENNNRQISLNNSDVFFESASANLNIYSYPREEKILRNNRKPQHFQLSVLPCEDFAYVRACVQGIRSLSDLNHNFHLNKMNKREDGNDATEEENTTVMVNKSKKYLVVVNPYSGFKKGVGIYQKTVSPMLEQAGIDHDLMKTQYAGHARERMKMSAQQKMFSKFSKEQQLSIHSMSNESGSKKGDDNTNINNMNSDISTYDAIIVVGGDGTLSEVLNGISDRSDSKHIFNTLKFGVVGTGRSNGLAKSLSFASSENFSELESMFLICKGFHTSLDLSKYTTQNNNYTGFKSFSLGAAAAGESLLFQHDFSVFWKMIFLRQNFVVKFSYLPPESTASSSKNNKRSETLTKNLPSLSSSTSLVDSKTLPEGWITIEDEFVLFHPSQVTHASKNFYTSPKSKLNDGIFRVLVIRKSSQISRFTLMRLWMHMEKGTHEENYLPKYCQVYECVAWRLEFPCMARTSSSIQNGDHSRKLSDRGYSNVLDGETIESGAVHACVDGTIQVFAWCSV